MIIELIGLSGAGKSTFARKLAGLGKYKKIRVNSRGELIWLNACFLTLHPVKFLILFFMYVRYAGPRELWYTKFNTVFLDYNAKYMKAKKYPFALLDQGHTQVLMSLFEDVIPKKKFKSFLSLLPRSDHYIFFDTPKKLRKQRIATRGYTLRPGMSEEMMAGWENAFEVHFRRLMDNKNILTPSTVDVIDASIDLNISVDTYQKAQFMRYITFARMPTEKAHGLQIVKMCECFTLKNIFISLITPKRGNHVSGTVDEYYKLKIPLQHYEASVFDLTGRVRNLKSIHHYIHELLFAWYVLWMHIPKEITVYTRTPLVSFVRGLRGDRVIAEQHFWPTRASWLHCVLLSSATLIPCNSDGTHEACVNHSLTQSFVAHNGFDDSVLEEHISQKDARLNLGLPVDGKVVMYIGSLGDWKGVDTLAEAAKDFDEDVTAVIIGGSEEEIQLWSDTYPNVTFLGSRPYVEIGQHQLAADILIVPNNPVSKESCEYTSPIKLFAHMASGVPLLVSDLPSMRAIVSEKDVTFFTAGDSESLLESVEGILSGAINSTTLSIQSKNKSKEFTWGSRAQKILLAFNETVV